MLKKNKKMNEYINRFDKKMENNKSNISKIKKFA